MERPLCKVDGAEAYSHFGFWRWLRGRVAHHLDIEQTQFTPMGKSAETTRSGAVTQN